MLIPEEAVAGFRKRSALLRRRNARRNNNPAPDYNFRCVVVLVVGGSLAWFVSRQMKARDFAGQLQSAIAQRQCHTAEK